MATWSYYNSLPQVWLTGNSAGHYKRATGMPSRSLALATLGVQLTFACILIVSALQLAIANCGGFVAAWIYRMRLLSFLPVCWAQAHTNELQRLRNDHLIASHI